MAEQLPGTYSGANIVNAVQNQIPAYNYQDPYGARQQIEQRLGFGEATQAEQQAKESLLGFQDTTRAQINALRANRNLSTGLEAGFEAQRTREATQQEQVLTGQLGLAQDKRMALESQIGREYDVYQRERANREAAMLDAMQYGADVNIGMGLEDIVKKGVEARKQQEREMEKKAKKEAEEERKRAYKQSLKDQLIAMGSSVKGLSKNELERKLKKKNKAAIAEAKKFSDLEYQSKLKSLTSTKDYKVDKSPSGQASMIEAMISTGASWHDVKKVFMEEGIQVDAGSYMDDYLKWRFEGGEVPNQSEK